MKSLLIKWHFHWYKHHLKWNCVYNGIDDKRAEYHWNKFFHHNRYLCRNAMGVLTAYQGVLLNKAFPTK